MKKNRIFILTALVLVGVFAFASCTAPAATKSTAVPSEEMATKEAPSEEPMAKDDETEKDNMTNDDTMEFTGDAFNFELTDTKGDNYKLSDLQGKKVYVKFWASWCSICLAGMGEFEELDASYKSNDDVLILTLVAPGTSGEMSSQKFKDWFASQGYEFTTLLNEGGSVMREYGIRGFPTSVFIDTMGNIAATKIGHVDNATIDSTLSGMS